MEWMKKYLSAFHVRCCIPWICARFGVFFAKIQVIFLGQCRLLGTLLHTLSQKWTKSLPNTEPVADGVQCDSVVSGFCVNRCCTMQLHCHRISFFARIQNLLLGTVHVAPCSWLACTEILYKTFFFLLYSIFSMYTNCVQ